MKGKRFLYELLVVTLAAFNGCTKDLPDWVGLQSDDATIYLDFAGSLADVREAIQDAESRGVVSYTVIGSISRLGFSSNPFAGTKVESLDIKFVTDWPSDAIPESYFRGESFPCLKSVILPDAVRTVGRSAFYQCDSLQIVRGNNVLVIEDGAFFGCTNLSHVVFPEAVALGSNVFSNCCNLVGVEMPELRRTGNSVFDRCTALKSVDFPKLETAYLSFCFKCDGLEFVNLPSARQIIGDAFTMCSSLKEIYVPAAEYVEGFLKCTSLTSLNLPNVKELGNLGFGDTPLEYLVLSASGDITCGEFTFSNSLPSFDSESCTLVLNKDKRPGGGSKPEADPETNTWAGAQWKQILFTD